MKVTVSQNTLNKVEVELTDELPCGLYKIVDPKSQYKGKVAMVTGLPYHKRLVLLEEPSTTWTGTCSLKLELLARSVVITLSND